MQQMSPDVHDCFSHVPAEWNVADLSQFCTDRDDRGIFVPVWAHMWEILVKPKAYQCHYQWGRDALIALVGSDAFRVAAWEHVQRYGVAPHVLKLVQQFGPVATWPRKKGWQGE